MRPASRALIADAIRALRAIEEFIRGASRDDYLREPILRSAVGRQFLIVGEALSQLRRTDADPANRISGFAEATGLRNVLAHSYAVADDDLIWQTAKSDAPDLLRELTALIAEEDQ